MKVVSPCGRAGLLLLLLFVSPPAWAVQPVSKGSSEPKKNTFTLIFEGNSVKAEIKQAPLEAVLMEMARQTDLSIEVDGSIADEKVSALFDPLPIEEGLHALLRNKNYILIYSEVVPAAGSDPQFKVEGVKIIGKGYGPLPPLFRAGYEREPSLPRPAEGGYDPGIGESVVNDSLQERDPRRPFVPLFPTPRNLPPAYQQPRETKGVAPYKTPEAPAGVVNSTNSASVNYNSGGQQQTIVPPIIPHKSAHERMDDLEALAGSKGMAAIPFLSQIANSDPDPDVREYAHDLIQDIQDEAEDP